jgi:hypothetical protein
VEPFRDAVVLGEPPHRGNLFFPGLKGFSENDQRLELRIEEFVDRFEEGFC